MLALLRQLSYCEYQGDVLFIFSKGLSAFIAKPSITSRLECDHGDRLVVFSSYDQHFMRPCCKQIKSVCFLAAMASLRQPLSGENLQKSLSVYAHYIHYMLHRISRSCTSTSEMIFLLCSTIPGGSLLRFAESLRISSWLVSRHCTSLGSCFLLLLDPSIKWWVEPVAFTLGILWRPHGKVKQSARTKDRGELLSGYIIQHYYMWHRYTYIYI